MNHRQCLNTTVDDEIRRLVLRGAEGAHWDYKAKHHEEREDLIHDVLCMANANHKGRRFLIIGVDNSGGVVGCTKKESADITALFKDNQYRFADARVPNIRLTDVPINGNGTVQAIVIEDAPYKPYYLTKSYQGVRASHIYTRTGDRNTPRDQSAAPHEVEHMWKERFGLTQSPLERAKIYLLEQGNWLCSEGLTDDDGDLVHFHKQFPEFTIRPVQASDSLACKEEWTRGEIRRDNNNAYYMAVYYHQTRLALVHMVTFDDGRKTAVAPYWEPRGKGRFYFHRRGSIEHAALSCELFGATCDISVRGSSGEYSGMAQEHFSRSYSIPIVTDAELRGFLGDQDEMPCTPSCDQDEQYELFWKNQLDFEKWRASSSLR